MPFGFFGIGNKKKKDAPIAPPVPTSPVVPITPTGQNYVSTVQPVYNPPVQPQTTPFSVPSWNVMSESSIRILVVAETVELAKDYLCSLRINADSAFVDGGLAYYSNDHATISEIIHSKKDLDMCFWKEPGSKWPKYPEEYYEEKEHIYTFTLSASGYQEKNLELSFCCVTPYTNNISTFVQQANSVWIINPNTANRNEENAYESGVKQLVFSLGSKSVDKEFIIVVTQFENEMAFRGSGSLAELDSKLRNALYEGCRKIYADTFEAACINAKICLAQIYGGLELLEYNEYDKPVFYVNGENLCGSYLPEACHIPLYYTLTNMHNSGMAFFRDSLGDIIWQGIFQSFEDYIGRKQWESEFVVN